MLISTRYIQIIESINAARNMPRSCGVQPGDYTMKTFIVLKRLPTDDDKLGPQIKACANAVVASVKDGKPGERAERKNVIETLTKSSELTTRQDPARILSFYQPQLTEKGIIEIVKESEPKPEKPAKETAAKPAAAGANKEAAPAAAPKPAAAAPKPAAGATA
jgi:hypothetical protein